MLEIRFSSALLGGNLRHVVIDLVTVDSTEFCWRCMFADFCCLQRIPLLASFRSQILPLFVLLRSQRLFRIVLLLSHRLPRIKGDITLYELLCRRALLRSQRLPQIVLFAAADVVALLRSQRFPLFALLRSLLRNCTRLCFRHHCLR